MREWGEAQRSAHPQGCWTGGEGALGLIYTAAVITFHRRYRRGISRPADVVRGRTAGKEVHDLSEEHILVSKLKVQCVERSDSFWIISLLSSPSVGRCSFQQHDTFVYFCRGGGGGGGDSCCLAVSPPAEDKTCI